MKIPTMRRIDLLAGVPLSWMLNTLYAAANALGVGRHRRAAAVRAEPRRILVLKFLGLGSLVLAGPLLRALRERHPGCSIELATFDENRDSRAFLPLLDAVHVVRRSSLLLFALDSIRLVLLCWTSRLDVLLDLEIYSKYSTLLTALCGAPVRIGFFEVTTRFRRGIYSDLVFFNKLRHVTGVYATLGACLGAGPARCEPITPTLPDSAEAEAGAFLEASDGPVLAVNVNASDLCLERRWPPERFAGVVTALLEQYPSLRAVYVGAPSERTFTLAAAGLVPGHLSARVSVAAGRLSLLGFAALLRRSIVLLSNDSGPVHIAWALQVPTVSLWGPGTPAFYGPNGGIHDVLWAGVPCSPCLYFTDRPPCGGVNVCMTELSEAAVLAATALRLSSRFAGEVPGGK